MTASALDYARRNDTMLGVCESIGDDMGVSANWFRIAFAAAFFFFPLQAVLAYLGLFALTALLRRVMADETVPAPAPVADPNEEIRLAA